MKVVVIVVALFALSVTGYVYYVVRKPSHVNVSMETILDLQDHYSTRVQPIFNAKCVACHSCYNSPCQLNLSSYEGVSRGANKISIYDFPALKSRTPTRLYIDAHTIAGWRGKGFFSVIRESRERPSLLEEFVTKVPGIESGLQSAYDSEESRVCSDTSDVGLKAFKASNPAGRMPFGLPKLADHEVGMIDQWLNEAAHPPDVSVLEARVLDHPLFESRVQKWEALFNGEDMKSRLSSRYIYEHLFLAHLYFGDQPEIFFRLVRSRTKSGKIDEIGTHFAFDPVGERFYYRLRPVTNSLTHKDHIPFELSDEKLNAYRNDFYESKWKKVPETMPGYGRAGANPFNTFIDIPIRARYKFFLDEAGYHVMTFIKGPVCRGQTALNVINDHFWVLFMDPEYDAMVNDPILEEKIARNSAFPAEIKDDIDPFIKFRKSYWENVGFKADSMRARKAVLDVRDIWNGEGRNTNASLTIYRHFDSAEVLRGLRGHEPRTVWVLDYQVFESIYYNLAAGYDVFGPLLHQVNSRLYMEMSRLAAEDLFITFLPKEDRLTVRDSWNHPPPKQKESISKKAVDLFLGNVRDKLKFDYPYAGANIISSAEKTTPKLAKARFLNEVVRQRFSPEQTRDRDDLRDAALRRLTELKASAGKFLPDTILLRVVDADEVYTVIHNKEHYNVSLMFLEDDLREPQADTVDVVRGVATSYANAFVSLKRADLESFVTDLEKVRTGAEMDRVLKAHVLSRRSPDFWSAYHWFSEQTGNKETNESGLIDLNRYGNF